MIDSNIIHTIHDVIYTPAEGQDLSLMHLKKILINVNKWRSQKALNLFWQVLSIMLTQKQPDKYSTSLFYPRMYASCM